jgi:UDP-hydrolysing UDP-N-acetyl-D-glucosamine 2-epimerase
MNANGLRKVCAVITARPSYSRIQTALTAMADDPSIELQLVVGASALLDRYGSAIEVIEKDGLDIAARVFMVLEGESPMTMAKTAGIGLLELSTVFGNLRPDLVVTVADRYETIATAVAASYMNLPLVHLQGGEVSGSIDEKVRHAVTKLADVHMVATELAAKRVVAMGERPESVFVTGCPSIDLAAEVSENSALDFDPLERYGGVGGDLDLYDGYVIVVQHPVTTQYELARQHALETLYAVRGIGSPALWFWPNVDAGSDGTARAIRSFRENERPPNIHFFKNMQPRDFLRVVANSKCVVGNSSVGIRECSYLGVPVVNIGDRQEGRERGINVVDVGYDREEIAAAVTRQFETGRFPLDTLYGDGRSGRRIAELMNRIELTTEKRLSY